MIKVALILNQIKFRSTLEHILKMESKVTVSSFGINYPAIKETFTQDPPNVVIVESSAMDNGIKLVKFLRDSYPTVRILAFINSEFEDHVLALSKLGVKGFLNRTQSSQLPKVIEVVAIGGIYFPDSFSEIFQRQIISFTNSGTANENLLLTPIDLLLIRLICEGLSSTQIGAILKKSHRTIEDHRDRLYKKFNVTSKEKFITEAVKKNMI